MKLQVRTLYIEERKLGKKLNQVCEDEGFFKINYSSVKQF